MAFSIQMKRLAREIPDLRKTNPNYFVSANDGDLTSFHAYIVGPDDSCYAGKLVKLKIEVPVDYPSKPPNCTFIQYQGNRIHPNLYSASDGGKVCLSILNTWPGPRWAQTMTIESIIISIQSILDSKPYLHEPSIVEDSKQFNDYVRYTTWQWLLLDYISSETDQQSKLFLQTFLKEQGPRIWKALQEDKKMMGNMKVVKGHYHPKVEIVTWPKLEKDVQNAIVSAGGNLYGFSGSGRVLSSDPSTESTAISVDPSVPAMHAAREKRKLDAIDLSSMRPGSSKKQATNTEYAKKKSSQNTKSWPQKEHEVIDLSDDRPLPKKKSGYNTSTRKKNEVIDLSDDEPLPKKKSG